MEITADMAETSGDMRSSELLSRTSLTMSAPSRLSVPGTFWAAGRSFRLSGVTLEKSELPIAESNKR